MNTLSLKALENIRKSSLDIKDIYFEHVPNNVTTMVKHETYLLS